MYTDIDDILDLPLELPATVIPQRVGCYPEDSQPQRDAIGDEVRQLLKDSFLSLGFPPPTTEEPSSGEPEP